jgi:FMN phosphatase YigB (HAD superfamily)
MQAISISSDNVDIMKSSQELGGLKPAPQLFLKLADQLKIAPEKILVVGDRDDTDGQGAINSGMKFIQIRKASTKDALTTDSHPLLFWEEFAQVFTE